MLEPAAILVQQEMPQISGRPVHDHMLVNHPVFVARLAALEEPKIPRRKISAVPDLPAHENEDAIEIKAGFVNAVRIAADNPFDLLAQLRADRFISIEDQDPV